MEKLVEPIESALISDSDLASQSLMRYRQFKTYIADKVSRCIASEIGVEIM